MENSCSSFSKFVVLLFLQLCVFTTMALKSGFTIKVEAGRKECFYEDIDIHNLTLDVEYQVIEGGELDIDFYVKLPSGKRAVEDIRKQDETHTVTTTEEGTYEFCFDNSFSSMASKTIFADLGISAVAELNDDETPTTGIKDDLEDGLEEGPIAGTLERIRGNLERVSHMQNFIRSAEARDYKLIKSNLSRVFWWSLIQSFALIGVALVQVNIVKHFFGGGKFNARV